MRRLFLILALVSALTPAVAFADESIVERALSFLGIRYRFGSESEERGFDCAGFVRRAFAGAGVRLPRTAALQFREGCAVTRAELQPGDMVFFSRTYKRGISHVGIYIGEGRFVHAASSRRKVVVDHIDAPYYASRFAGGRRIPQAQAAVVANASADASATGSP